MLACCAQLSMNRMSGFHVQEAEPFIGVSVAGFVHRAQYGNMARQAQRGDMAA